MFVYVCVWSSWTLNVAGRLIYSVGVCQLRGLRACCDRFLGVLSKGVTCGGLAAAMQQGRRNLSPRAGGFPSLVAGGQEGVVPEAVSRVWLPGAPRSGCGRLAKSSTAMFLLRGPTHVNSCGTAFRGVYPTLCVWPLARFVRANQYIYIYIYIYIHTLINAPPLAATAKHSPINGASAFGRRRKHALRACFHLLI